MIETDTRIINETTMQEQNPDARIMSILSNASREVSRIIRQEADSHQDRIYLQNFAQTGDLKMGATYDINTGELSFDGAVRPAQPEILLANYKKILGAVKKGA
jgi:hypothetical protein